MGSLLPAQPGLGGSRRSDRTALYGLADIGFERAAVISG
jgi:hypothetical protein